MKRISVIRLAKKNMRQDSVPVGFSCLADVAARRRQRSVDSSTMLVPSTCRSTLGDRAFPVAAARVWNSLPPWIRAASSLLTFQQETKSHLFRQSFGWW